MATAKTNLERQRKFRGLKIQDGEKELRGIFAPMLDHPRIKKQLGEMIDGKEDPAKLAAAWRAAEDTARQQYPDDHGRHAYYAGEAERYEAIARKGDRREQ